MMLPSPPPTVPCCLQVGRGRAANLAELARSTTPAWAVHGGMRCVLWWRVGPHQGAWLCRGASYPGAYRCNMECAASVCVACQQLTGFPACLTGQQHQCNAVVCSRAFCAPRLNDPPCWPCCCHPNRSLEPAGRLASELLPYARTLAARGGYPALARLQPARWSRFWNGQLYEQQGGAQAAGGGWEEQEQADTLAAAAGAAGSEQQAAEADAIEESEDEDDW